MSKVKVEKSLDLAERILNLNKKNFKIITMLVDELETNETIHKKENKEKRKVCDS